MQDTVPDWIEAVRELVGEYGSASAAAAADFYDAERVAAQVTGRFTVPLLDPPPDEQVEASLRWATKDVWPRAPDNPDTTDAQRAPLEARLEAAEKKAEAVAQKLVTDQGRGTVQAAVQQDRMAIGYARAAALGACAFCRLLATRGMVYKQNTADFRAHDGCNCGVIPVFKGQRFELSDHAREWDQLYREYAAPFPGDQLRRFRRAVAEHG
ncbi:hypothetical protein OG298_45575 (plasmid) [Streptomyces sp. NBC_01005]|uniref:VG15 protein n=1 Tax=unclassified Streptomyces TaxID=2593676 RepID=UPI0038675677|nr:hypothetical protein OG298_45575 [Streptomyces sp. NBC_01005]